MKRVLGIFWLLIIVAVVVATGNRYDSVADFVNDKGWVMSGFLIAAVLAVVMIVITDLVTLARGKRQKQNGFPPS